MPRAIHTISKKGLDSVYYRNLDCSSYKFYIDQTKNEIYNTDSLPYGINNKKILCSVNSKNYGAVGIKSMTSDTLSFFSSADSIDFSQPRDFYVYSSAGMNYRKYTVSVNVHKEEADSFRWNRMATVSELADLRGMRAVSNAGNLFVLGTDGDKTLIYRSSDGLSWTDITSGTGGALTARAFNNVVTKGGYIYLYDNGQVLRTDNGTSWTITGRHQLTRLVAASRNRLYAYDASGAMVESDDEGASWTPSPIDDEQTLLPTVDVSYVCLPLQTNSNADRVVLIGNRNPAAYPHDTTPQTWSRIDLVSENGETQPWMYYDVASDNNKKAPHVMNMQTVVYDGCILAVGGNGIGGDTHRAFDGIYHSVDGGITWQKNVLISLPAGFSAQADSYAIATDSDNFLWIICGHSGNVWRGRINRLGWTENKDVFIE